MLQPTARDPAQPAPADDRSTLAKVGEVLLVLTCVMGFIFAGMWANDWLTESQHPECAAITNCTSCNGACGWCSQGGKAECSALCHTELGECSGDFPEERRTGGGFYWFPFFWVFWFPCCGFYGYRGYYYGGYAGYGGRYRRPADQSDERLVQQQPQQHGSTV